MRRAAYVTGGESGTGLSIREHLAQAGLSVVVADYKGTGDDIAAASMYLASAEASYVTGQIVSVNGGSFVGW